MFAARERGVSLLLHVPHRLLYHMVVVVAAVVDSHLTRRPDVDRDHKRNKGHTQMTPKRGIFCDV